MQRSVKENKNLALLKGWGIIYDLTMIKWNDGSQMRFKEWGQKTCNSEGRQTTAQKVAGVLKLRGNRCMTNV